MAHAKIASTVQASLDGTTSNRENGVSGLVFVAMDRNGEVISANASGTKGLNNKKPMDMDTVFWIASCTKLIATISCLQLVEKGVLKLDDPKHLYQYCPEIEKAQVLQPDGTLKPRKNDVTLRQLLSHTAGYGYEFFNPYLRDYGRPIGFDVFGADVEEIYKMPLVNEPGTDWQYGVSRDRENPMFEMVMLTAYRSTLTGRESTSSVRQA